LKDELNALSSHDDELMETRRANVAYQYVREPLRAEEADALSHACETTEEKLIIWTLLDTGLRVSELCSLTPQHVLWQQKAFRVLGKGGPYGKQSKQRVVPMSRRIQPLMEHYFALHETWFVGPRQVQKIVKRLANRAKIPQEVTPHVLRHTAAMELLAHGVDRSVIALWLGHESIETTHGYLEIDLATKEQALHKLAPVEGPLARFTAPDPLLAFLTSL